MKNAALLFPGQGAQYVGMGKDLYDTFPEAKAVFEKADQTLGLELSRICFFGPAEELQKTRFAQVAIFTVSMAVFEVLRKKSNLLGRVAGAAGLSLGEATALVSAGVWNLDHGLQFVRDRGLYMDEASHTSPGSMAAILELDIPTVEKICAEAGIEIGNLNCPGQVVISGNHEGLKRAIQMCQDAGARRAMALDVSGAFHSKCMDSACERIKLALKKYPLKTPQFPVVSNLTGKPESDIREIETNLTKQMNHRTLWEDSMRYFLKEGVTEFYELGPGKVLKGLMRKIDSKAKVISIGTADEIKAFLGEKQHA